MIVVNTPFGLGAALDFTKKFMTADNKKRINVVRGGCQGLVQHCEGLLNDPKVGLFSLQHQIEEKRNTV